MIDRLIEDCERIVGVDPGDFIRESRQEYGDTHAYAGAFGMLQSEFQRAQNLLRRVAEELRQQERC